MIKKNVQSKTPLNQRSSFRGVLFVLGPASEPFNKLIEIKIEKKGKENDDDTFEFSFSSLPSSWKTSKNWSI